ncbi:HNRNP arginine N-methyltransferase [Patellaria atrata CBS 101060]|uniref:type I protein arginine methyltransferase n=1 Tax=Patellaria atrata CBS 101060 TaxID=1346257 RepID=A0A9P4SCA8_9PEZI|nr:HNRNP arginine N-methyltransferase [Patellaria atrata CBS 101060]
MEDDTEKIEVIHLFNNGKYSDVKSMIEDCKSQHNFDFIGVQRQFDLDFYSTIKLVNYIRAEVKKGNLSPDLSSKEKFSDETYLQPVLENDALLFCLDELTDLDFGASSAINSSVDLKPAPSGENDSSARIKELEEQLQQLQTQFSVYRSTVEKTLDERWNGPQSSDSKSTPKGDTSALDEKGYFEAYSYNDIHETMLKDTVRTDAYRDFIYENKHLFQGKIVLDVGCGTGILSMFCARAGASKVFAVDNSAIIDKARENVFNNQLTDKITCLRGKIEEVKLPVEKVDIIVSEWMGYCLLFEAMLDSVLWARDHYLATDGLLIPSHCTLLIAPMADSNYVADNIDFWRDVYGFDMSAMMAHIYDDVLIKRMPMDSLAGAPAIFCTLPLHRVSVDDLSFTKDFTVELNENVDALDGWIIWFDTFFLTSRSSELRKDARGEDWKNGKQPGIAFTTGPAGKETHWQSGVMLVDHGKKAGVPLEAGQKITGTIVYKKQGENGRSLEISVSWKFDSENEHQTWHLK